MVNSKTPQIILICSGVVAVIVLLFFILFIDFSHPFNFSLLLIFMIVITIMLVLSFLGLVLWKRRQNSARTIRRPKGFFSLEKKPFGGKTSDEELIEKFLGPLSSEKSEGKQIANPQNKETFGFIQVVTLPEWLDVSQFESEQQRIDAYQRQLRATTNFIRGCAQIALPFSQILHYKKGRLFLLFWSAIENLQQLEQLIDSISGNQNKDNTFSEKV